MRTEKFMTPVMTAATQPEIVSSRAVLNLWVFTLNLTMAESNRNDIVRFHEARREVLIQLDDLFDDFLKQEPLSQKPPIERDQTEHFTDHFSKSKFLTIKIPDSKFPNFWEFFSRKLLST